MTDEGAGGKADVITDADVGGVSENGCRENAAVFANRVKIAVAAEIFGIFFSPRLADQAVESGEFAVTHGEPADDFIKNRSHNSSL
jgi:hypothetical protein